MCNEFNQRTAWQTGYNDIVYGNKEYNLPGCNCKKCKKQYQLGWVAGMNHLTTASGDKGQKSVKLQSDNSGPCA